MADNKRLLELALQGLKLERAHLDAEIADLRSKLDGPAPSIAAKPALQAKPAAAPSIKRSGPAKMSAAARKAISDAMKRRWAERRRSGK